jgi:hypothetical protein
MSGLKTTQTNKDPYEYLNSLEDTQQREDSKKLIEIFKEASGKAPKIWGTNPIIGFGNYTYKRKNDKKTEYAWFNVGFAPRKAAISIYLTCNLEEKEAQLHKLGKCTWGRGCIYVKKLADIDIEVLKQLIIESKDSEWY